MEKSFDRFLRWLDDAQLERFAEERAALRPPSWRLLRMALRMEAFRRGLDLGHILLRAEGEGGAAGRTAVGADGQPSRSGR